VPSDTRSDRSVPVSVVGIHERSQSHSILRFDFDGFETREPRRDVIAPAFDGFWIASGEASRAASSTPPVSAAPHLEIHSGPASQWGRGQARLGAGGICAVYRSAHLSTKQFVISIT
jgi:hypothetical protein